MNPNQAPELWSVRDIAEWLDKAPATIARTVVTLPRFPSPLPGSRQNRRWLKDEVIEFMVMKGRRAA